MCIPIRSFRHVVSKNELKNFIFTYFAVFYHNDKVLIQHLTNTLDTSVLLNVFKPHLTFYLKWIK